MLIRRIQNVDTHSNPVPTKKKPRQKAIEKGQEGITTTKKTKMLINIGKMVAKQLNQA